MQSRWAMLAVLFTVRLGMGYQFQSVASVSPHLIADLGLSHAEIGTLIGLYMLPGLFISVPSGLLTRRFRDRHLLLLGLALMALGTLVFALADSPGVAYAGRAITGIGSVVFNIIVMKMATDWFADKELVTAMAVMLTTWPIGISLGLLTHGVMAELWGWATPVLATGAVALGGLVLAALLAREAPVPVAMAAPRLTLPRRQLVHVTAAGLTWALFNAALIVQVSFTPGALVAFGHGRQEASSITSLAMWVMLVSVPLGGRLIEASGRLGLAIVLTSVAAAGLLAGLGAGLAPAAMCALFGLIAGAAAGPVMSLSAEAMTAENRGPGFGLFYTWYYVGMAVAPAVAGWAFDATGQASAPLHAGAVMMALVAVSLVVLRILQRTWPIG